jgi:hypothetical protein
VKAEINANSGNIRDKIDAGIKKRKEDILKEINAEKIAKEDKIAEIKR